MLAEEPHGHRARAEIVKAMGRGPSEIYRMLERLVVRDYVTRSQDGDRYSLSLKLFVLGHRHPPIERLVARALPAMDAFARAAEQSCHLGIYDRGNVVVVAQVNGPGSWGLSIRLGVLVSLVDTGSGHILLTFRSEQRRVEMLAEHKVLEGEVPMPEAELYGILGKIRDLGYWQGDSQQAFGDVTETFRCPSSTPRATPWPGADLPVHPTRDRPRRRRPGHGARTACPGGARAVAGLTLVGGRRWPGPGISSDCKVGAQRTRPAADRPWRG